LTTSSSIRHPVEAGSLRGIGRLVRQICLLREQAEPAQAAHLQENELAEAVRELQATQGPEALPESELQAMFAREERRVAEAAIMAELLVPRLVRAWPAASGPAVAGNSRPVPFSSPAAVRAAAPAGSPDIPDLLDAMLAAERNSRRLPATVKPES
jgi:hypothetical protein